MKRSSRASRRPHVALLVETSLASGRDVLLGIAQYVRDHGPWSIFQEPRGLEAGPPPWLKTWRGDGIIVRLQDESVAAAVLATGLPAVDVLGVAAHPAIPLVHVQDEQIATLAAEHLLERGFRHFGFCGLRGVNWSERRCAAFARRVTAAGGDLGIYLLPRHSTSRASWEQQQDALGRWLMSLPKPVGVMACNDPRGQLVLEAARRVGISAPDEVAVIGVDNDEPICELSDPPLTSVCGDLCRVGYEAAALLDRMMDGEPAPREPLLAEPKGIVVRRSTQSLAIEDTIVAAAARYIGEHACRGIGVLDVLKVCPYSRSTLHRRFQEIVGRSVHDEIVRVRLAEAQRLLATSDLPLTMVAERAGFKHQEYMGAVFKAMLDVTPARYRRQRRR